MLYYDRIDISEGIDLAKSNNSKECMICHYFFFNHRFEFQDSVCYGCHDLTMLSVNISDLAIITVKNLIIVVLFITLANLKELIYSKILSRRSWVSVKKYCQFFFYFVFSIYKILHSIRIHKSLNIKIGTVMKNPEMLKLVPDHLETKRCVIMFLIDIRLKKCVIELL